MNPAQQTKKKKKTKIKAFFSVLKRKKKLVVFLFQEKTRSLISLFLNFVFFLNKLFYPEQHLLSDTRSFCVVLFRTINKQTSKSIKFAQKKFHDLLYFHFEYGFIWMSFCCSAPPLFPSEMKKLEQKYTKKKTGKTVAVFETHFTEKKNMSELIE